VLMLMTILLLAPSLSQADGLFDFQMKLAKKGNAEAQFKVGEMYETGFGVKEDKTEAMNWITKAASQGHETASFKLLYWDIKKNGVNNANKAEFEALKTKANEGNAQAQYYVGKMYSQGVGVKRNSNKAVSWLNKAALVGVLEAERELELVRENQQRWAAEKKRKDEKKRAELKAKQEKERLARQEDQRKLQAQKNAEAKARSDQAAKQNADAAAKSKANQQAAEQAQKEKLLAQQQAAAKQREAEKRALIKKREAEDVKRKTQFESDPCSGKSARFLSTCK
ncbi:MAG: sel1 repeat family protein, partial [Proteobacteria bacterium]|nr:sel1 repeat family protein [Pseudomonadota bacterium]